MSDWPRAYVCNRDLKYILFFVLEYCILDCVFDVARSMFHVLDLMCWRGLILMAYFHQSVQCKVVVLFGSLIFLQTSFKLKPSFILPIEPFRSHYSSYCLNRQCLEFSSETMFSYLGMDLQNMLLIHYNAPKWTHTWRNYRSNEEGAYNNNKCAVMM